MKIYYEDILIKFSKKFNELKHIKIHFNSNNEFQGMCHSIPYGEYHYIGKMRYKMIHTDVITINPNLKDVLFTFLHEITHAITPQYERKVKNTWIRLDHSDKFYANFYKILELAYENNIINSLYNIKDIKKKDNCKENNKSDLIRFKTF